MFNIPYPYYVVSVRCSTSCISKNYQASIFTSKLHQFQLTNSIIQLINTSFTVEVEEYNKGASLEYYQVVFEAPFLLETGEYYRQQASKLVAEKSCSEYMHCVVSMLQTARRRGVAFLHQTSVTKVTCTCTLSDSIRCM